MHLDNSFISTTLCDDLARATEAQDGKKAATSQMTQPGSSNKEGPTWAVFWFVFCVFGCLFRSLVCTHNLDLSDCILRKKTDAPK